MKVRKTPQRICIACQEMKDKKSLFRIVREPNGEVAIDTTGKKAGRGAYICRSVLCINKAQKEKRLERTLKTGVDEKIYTDLKSSVEL